MKDYAALIPTATAEDVRWLVMEAAGDAELRFSKFAEIVRAAERRLSDLEDGQVLPSGDHPAVSDSAGSVRAASDIKKRKGWPDCVICELYTFTGECSAKDKSGLSPCEVMSRKMYKYLRRENGKEGQSLKYLTITPKEATERLTNAGIRIGYDKLRQALKQGKLPFGFTIDMEAGHTEFVIFSKDLDDFIRAHGGEPA